MWRTQLSRLVGAATNDGRSPRFVMVNHPLNTHSCAVRLSIRYAHSDTPNTYGGTNRVCNTKHIHSQYSRLYWTMNCMEDLFRKRTAQQSQQQEQRHHCYVTITIRKQFVLLTGDSMMMRQFIQSHLELFLVHKSISLSECTQINLAPNWLGMKK